MEVSKKSITQRIGQFLTIFFFSIIIYLLYQALAEIEISDVKMALTQFQISELAPILVLVFLNLFILGSFDFLGLRYFDEKKIHPLKIYWSAMICYTFTLNLGAVVGGLGLRYRIYRGWDIPLGTITKLITFSTLGNWIGHVLLLSIIMIIFPDKVRALTALPISATYATGILGLSAITLYFILCYRRTQMTFKSEKFTFPPLSLALLQLLLSLVQWSILASIVKTLMTQIGTDVDFSQVLFTYLLTGIAGVLTHIPAGLGVHEAIFLKMNFNISPSKLIAVLIAFRFLYYLTPLIIAAPGYFLLELYQRRQHLR